MTVSNSLEFTPAPRASTATVDPLDRLVAIEAIRLLKSRYFQAVDEKTWSTIAELFTDDARVDFGGEGQYHVGHHGVTAEANSEEWVVVGGAAAARVIAGAVSKVISVHQGHDPQIEIISADHAAGRWSMYDRLEYENEVMHGYGHYIETYARDETGWKFSSLLLTRLRVVWESK